jgi:transposase-like protein
MTTEPRTPAERRGRYFKEFRRDSAALVIDQRRNVADVARQMSINNQTLGNWVRQERIDRGEREGLTSAERAELAQLRRELRQVKEERDLLKKPQSFG